MKTLLLIKGLSKPQIKSWIKEQGLEKYYLDFASYQNFYSQYEWDSPGKIITKFSYSDLVVKRFIEVLNLKMTKGHMIVLDTDLVGIKTIKALSTVYGYTVFSKSLDIPSDYINNYAYYSEGEKYEEKKVGEKIKQFLSQNPVGIKVNNFNDILQYFINHETVIELSNKDTALFVSDLHSNYSLYRKLPREHASCTILLGDYIDGLEKGGSKKLIEQIGKDGNSVWIEGNHEISLRKYLGSIIYPDLLKEFYEKTVYSDFKEKTQEEFAYLEKDPNKAADLLGKLNKHLVEYAFLRLPEKTLVCSHCGIRNIQQLDPRYISSVIYGSHGYSDINDSIFSKNSDRNLYSIHAHCKYSCSTEEAGITNQKYKRVINLDPLDQSIVSYCTINEEKFEICHLER